MQHLAIIPDGNRRWARKDLKATFWGHKQGTQTVKTAIQFCLKNNIKHLSFYTFSLENFNRPEAEKNYLFELLANDFEEHLAKLKEQQVCVKFVGQNSSFPERLQPVIKVIERETREFNKLFLNLLFCYGAKQEIVDAAKRIAEKVKAGILNSSDIDEKVIHQHLWSSNVPDPDLIIRTGGLNRLSNFLLYQAAYSEFLFLDIFWPEITEKHLEDCLNKFNSTQRNFGK